MLTVDFARLPTAAGDRVLDLGSGGGRHSFEALRRGARVVALDHEAGDLREVATFLETMQTEGEAPAAAAGAAVRGDALALPFSDGAFDCVIAAEILEHIPDDERAIAEIARVVRPGGLVAVTVPRWWPERLCWALSQSYHNTPGGHVRIYTGRELQAKLRSAGLEHVAHHHAHALHAPYWWLKCAVGVDRNGHPLPRAYHRLLVWDITARPWITRAAERVLDPVAGKSLVMYLRKAERRQPRPTRAAAGRERPAGAVALGASDHDL